MWLKWLFLGISMASVVIAVLLMWMHKDAVVPEVENTAQASSTSVDKPLMVERKGDRIIWRLRADAAKQEESIMVLTLPVLELFTETDEIIVVQGLKAWFEPLKRNIHFKGDVDVKYRDWLLKSDELWFDSQKDEVVVPNAFTATGTDTVVKGRGLRADRKTQKIHVAHDVWVKDARSDRLGGLP